jgi:hypothetical protein
VIEKHDRGFGFDLKSSGKRDLFVERIWTWIELEILRNNRLDKQGVHFLNCTTALDYTKNSRFFANIKVPGTINKVPFVHSKIYPSSSPKSLNSGLLALAQYCTLGHKFLVGLRLKGQNGTGTVPNQLAVSAKSKSK